MVALGTARLNIHTTGTATSRRPRRWTTARRAAVVGDRVVAFTMVERADVRIWSGMTRVRRSHRGRGLAKALKVDALTASVANGVTHTFTSVDDSHGPMRVVSALLGYRLVATQYPPTAP